MRTLVLTLLLSIFILGSLPTAINGGGVRPTEVQQHATTSIDQFLQQKFQSLTSKGVTAMAVSITQNGTNNISRVYGKGWTNQSLFRFGQIGDVFTGLGILSLVSTGNLSLDLPVNGYFGKNLPISYDGEAKNFSVRQLLTYTAGLDSMILGTHVQERQNYLNLTEFFKHRHPRLIQEPGELMSYTSVSHSILAMLIENKTGNYTKFMRDKIFKPLGLSNTFLQPILNSTAAARLIPGQNYRGISIKNELYELYPSLNLVATPSDISHLALQLVNPHGFPLLNDSFTNKVLYSPAFNVSKDFFLRTLLLGHLIQNGTDVYSQLGDGVGYSSGVFLYPKYNLSIVLSMNRELYVSRENLVKELFAKFFLKSTQTLKSSYVSDTSFFGIRKFTGTYIVTSFVESTFEKALKIAPERSIHYKPLELKIYQEGVNLETYLLTPNGIIHHSWIQYNTNVFYQINSTEVLIFKLSATGFSVQMVYISVLGMPLGFEKRSFLEDTLLTEALMITMLSVMGLIILYNLIHKRYRKLLLNSNQDFYDRIPILFTTFNSFLAVMFPLLFLLSILYIKPDEFIQGIPLMVGVILTIPLFTTILLVGLVLYLILARKTLKTSRVEKLYFLIFLAVNILNLYLLINLNLFGYNY